MNIEPAAGWLVAAVSAAGNVVQLIKGLRRSDAEIDHLKQETEQLWQEMQFKALEKAHELQDVIREQAQEWLDRMRNERDEFAAQNRLLLSRVDTLENTVDDLARQLADERAARKQERLAWQVERQELLTKIRQLETKLKEYKRQLGVVQDATSTQPL